jgi:hypothetical protein
VKIDRIIQYRYIPKLIVLAHPVASQSGQRMVRQPAIDSRFPKSQLAVPTRVYERIGNNPHRPEDGPVGKLVKHPAHPVKLKQSMVIGKVDKTVWTGIDRPVLIGSAINLPAEIFDVATGRGSHEKKATNPNHKQKNQSYEMQSIHKQVRLLTDEHIFLPNVISFLSILSLPTSLFKKIFTVILQQFYKTNVIKILYCN